MKCFPILVAGLFIFVFFATPVQAQTWSGEPVEFSRIAGFSQSIVIDGEDIIVTRTGESTMFPSPASQKGAVFIFRNDSNGWHQVEALIPEEIAIGDRFGQAMVRDGNWLAVSAPGANQGCGLVVVFERKQNGTWQQQALLDNPDCEVDGRLGWSLEFHEDALYAGAPGTEESMGGVHVFTRNDSGQWQRDGILTSGETGDYFGESVSAASNTVLVGAPAHGKGIGAVYAFNKGSGDKPAILSASGEQARYFGMELSLDGNLLLVSAPGMWARENGFGFGPPVPGTVYAFQQAADGVWSELGAITQAAEEGATSTANGFGASLTLIGKEAWIGAPFGGSRAGAVYLYQLDETSQSWEHTQMLATRPLAIGARFGAQLAVANDLAVIGAIRADFGEGRGVVYRRDADGIWQEESSLSDSGRGLTAITGDERTCIDGTVDQFDCEGVDLLSFLPIKDVGGERGTIVNDVWGWTDPETGKEYAIVGRSNGTSFVDVSDPSAPVFVADLPATEGTSPNAWRDVKVYQDHAFVVADNVGKHGMQIFDLTLLRGVKNPPQVFKETVLYDPIYSAHNVIINEDTGFAYIVAASGGGETCGGGYHMVDVRDPKAPAFVGCFSDPSSGAGGNHIHDAQCVVYEGPDEDHRDSEICFGANASVFSIADVSDKDNPKTVAALDYPNVAYVHQGWLTEDQKYFYINDEGDEVGGLVDATRTLIWDVTDLDDPIFVKSHLGTTRASDHNFYIKDNLMYQSNYVSGLQILDISDPVNPKQVAHFDTMPWGENAPGFAGSWSNYPYFKSGTIVVSSITEGLFLVRKSKEFAQ